MGMSSVCGWASSPLSGSSGGPFYRRALHRAITGAAAQRAPSHRLEPPQEPAGAAHQSIREEEHHGDEEPAQHQEPEIRVRRGEDALEPAHADGADDGPE